MVLDVISGRRASREKPNDVLSQLLRAHDASGAERLSDLELRDATLTLLLSGHETTANALSWAFIHAAAGHTQSLPSELFCESLRLSPSIWLIERRAKAVDWIGGFRISAGSSVLISPYVLHRHPAFWPEPERFMPSRFSGEQPRHRDGYMPYGLGPHRCVGLYLANKMAAHILSRVHARLSLSLVPSQFPGTSAGITLRHAGPVYMRVSAG